MAKDVSYKLSLDAKGFSAGVKEAKGQFNSLVTDVAADSGKLGEVLSAVGPAGVLIAATAGAMVMLGKATFDAAAKAVDFAGKISDLSTKSGIGGEALQKLAYAGSLVGTQLEDVTQSVMKLQEHMVKAPEDFKQLGLSMTELKKLAPEKQFEEVGRAILAIEDPAQRTAATIALLGKGGQEALKLLSLDLKATGDEAERLGNVMHDDTRVALDALGDSVTTLSTTWDHLIMNWGGSIAQIPEIQQLVKDLTEKLGEMSRWVLANKDQIGEYAKEAISWGKSFATAIGDIASALIKFKNSDAYKVLSLLNAPVRMALTGGGLGEAWSGFSNWAGWSGGQGGQSLAGQWNSNLAPGLGWGAPAGATNSGGHPPGWIDPAKLKEQQALILKNATAWTNAAAAMRKADDEFTAGVKNNAYQQLIGIENLFDKRGKAHAQMLNAELLAEYAHRDMLMKLGEQNEAIWKEYEKRKFDHQMSDIQSLGGAVRDLGAAMGSGGLATVGTMGSLFGSFAKEAKQAKTDIEKVTVAVQALAAAYSAGAQSKSPGTGALMGAASGAGAGFGMGGWIGALAGAVIGGAAGYAGGKKGQAEELAGLQKQFNDLQAKAKSLGITIADALHPNSAVWLRSQIDDITKAIDTTTEAHQKLTDAAARYGFTLEELGPVMAKQQLDEQMGQIYQDWQLLTAAGVDHEAMLTRVGPEVGKLADQYVQAGVEIPAAMKPVIDDLYQHGKLIHENGEAYTEAEYNGLTYAQTMSQMFMDLIKHVDDLVAALTGIPNVTRTVTVNTVHTGTPAGQSPPGEEGGGETQQPMARGGIVRARAGGTLIRAGEGGEDEYVIPKSKMGGWGGDVHLHVDARGATDPKAVEKQLTRVVQDPGPVRDALDDLARRVAARR